VALQAEIQANESSWARRNIAQLNIELGAIQSNIPQITIQDQAVLDEPPSDHCMDNNPDNNPHDVVQEELPIDPNQTYGEYIRGSIYKEKRLREERNWNRVLDPMFIAYMKSSFATGDWGDVNTWDMDRNPTCACTAGQRSKRSVDSVDILCEVFRFTQCLKTNVLNIHFII
jgi:hypothetical protein